MYIYLSSSFTLHLDLLGVSIKQKRPEWFITAHTSLANLCESEGCTSEGKKYDIVVIETSYKQFSHFTHHIEKLRILEIPTIFLVDEGIGEVYFHTNNVPHFRLLYKNVKLPYLIEVLERSNCFKFSNAIKRKLTDFEESLLSELSKGQSIEYLHKEKRLSYMLIEEALENINRYFNTSHYLQSVYKAHELNYLQSRSFE